MSSFNADTKPLPPAPTNSHEPSTSVAPPAVPHSLGLRSEPAAHEHYFRWKWFETTANGAIFNFAQQPAAIPSVADLSRFYAKAEFLNLQLVVVPLPHLVHYAQNITVAWVKSGTVVDPDTIENIPGSSSITVGGAMNFGTPTEISCPCQSMVCVFKDVVPFNYNPIVNLKVNMAVPVNPTLPVEANDHTFAFYIQGTLRVSSPIQTVW